MSKSQLTVSFLVATIYWCFAEPLGFPFTTPLPHSFNAATMKKTLTVPTLVVLLNQILLITQEFASFGVQHFVNGTKEVVLAQS
jgi:hypothetical protein